MNYNLYQSNSEFRAQLHQVADVVANMYSDIKNQKVYQDPDPSNVRAIFNEEMPETAMSFCVNEESEHLRDTRETHWI